MTAAQEAYLNEFFVHVFNKILAWEEQALSNVGAADLSVKELHVLEAVHDLSQDGRSTMTAVADSLSIRVSSLTAAVNTLVRKGYLERGGVPQDRRVIRIFLTEKGEAANRLHSAFHARMIEGVASRLGDMELEILTASLRQLDQFFNEMLRQGSSRDTNA